MMKWTFVKEYEKFDLWMNTKSGCRETFDKGVNPNDLEEDIDEE